MRRIRIPEMLPFYRDALITQDKRAFVKALEKIIGEEIGTTATSGGGFSNGDFKGRLGEAFTWSASNQGRDFWYDMKNCTVLNPGYTADMQCFHLALTKHPNCHVIHKDMLNLLSFYGNLRDLSGRSMLGSSVRLEQAESLVRTYFDQDFTLNVAQRHLLLDTNFGFLESVATYVLIPNGLYDGAPLHEFRTATINERLFMLLEASVKYKSTRLKPKPLTLNPLSQ